MQGSIDGMCLAIMRPSLSHWLPAFHSTELAHAVRPCGAPLAASAAFCSIYQLVQGVRGLLRHREPQAAFASELNTRFGRPCSLQLLVWTSEALRSSAMAARPPPTHSCRRCRHLLPPAGTDALAATAVLTLAVGACCGKSAGPDSEIYQRAQRSRLPDTEADRQARAAAAAAVSGDRCSFPSARPAILRVFPAATAPCLTQHVLSGCISELAFFAHAPPTGGGAAAGMGRHRGRQGDTQERAASEGGAGCRRAARGRA